MAVRKTLCVSLFGLLRVECDGQPIVFPTRKSRSLFAFLVLHPEPHPREQLAAMFWGDSPDADALHSLRTALAAIHKAMGDICIADRETVQLNPDYALCVDVREFENAVAENSARAVELYQGELLAEFYDDWILPERERLRGMYLDALLRLVQTHRAKGEYADAIALAQRVLENDAANERAHQHLMFCYLASGDRSAAIAQYEKCVQALTNELNVEPAVETRALYAQIQSAVSESGAARLTNLPHSLTSFIGREKEIAEIRALMQHTRLLTLTGAGGGGKTRLAIEVASGLAHANCFTQGVWFVELAPLTDATLVPQTVASVLGLREEPGRDILEGLKYFLRNKQMLLLLDNCEHLIDACAQLAETLLQEAPQLKILATSREHLNIDGETIFAVPVLALPDPEHLPHLDALMRYDAVQLFYARACVAQTHFALTEVNARSVAEICFHLDGIPLAIEMAAARVHTMSPQEIAEHLRERFHLLTGRRTALPHQQTLRTMLTWSYDLLSDSERMLFARLAVFAGGWTLEQAQAVCAYAGLDELDVLEGLTRLTDKSLVTPEPWQGTRRFRMLETVREFALDQLRTSGRLPELQNRHLQYFLALAGEAEPQLILGDPSWLARIESDFYNFRAALEYAMTADTASAVQLGDRLDWFWDYSNRESEGYAWAKRFLEATEQCESGTLRFTALLFAGSRAPMVNELEAGRNWANMALEMARRLCDKYCILRALYNLSVAAYYSRDWCALRALAQQELVLAQELDVTWMAAGALWHLGSVALAEQDNTNARSLFEQSLDVARRGKMPNVIAFCLSSLAHIARLEGDYALAKELYVECISILREMRHRSNLAATLTNLGQVELHEGDVVRALELFRESLAIGRELEDVEFEIYLLWGFAGAARIAHRELESAKLFGAEEALSKSVNLTLPLAAHLVYDPILDAVRLRLGESKFNAAQHEGRILSLEQALELALSETVI